MKSRPQQIPWSAQPVAAALADAVTALSRTHSAALILPGLWGADQVLEELKREAAVLHVDGGLNGGPVACPLVVALLAEDIVNDVPEAETVDEHLRQWAVQAGESTGRTPLVVMESAEHLDPAAERTLTEMCRQGLLQLVCLLHAEAHLPPFLHRMQHTAELQTLTPETLNAEMLVAGLKQRLGASVSAAAVQRIAALSGGHQVLTERVLTAALSSRVLYQVEHMWLWAADETPLHRALSPHGAAMLAGLEPVEQEVVTVLAAAGSLPERWACRYFSEEAVLSLRRQNILAPDRVQQQGYLDLKLLPEVIAYALRYALGDTELTRLWYKVGQDIPHTWAGPASQAALIWWASLAGVRLDAQTALRASTLCIARRWYHHVSDIASAAEEVTPRLRAALARAKLAMGHLDAAVTQLELLIQDLSGVADADPDHAEAQRQGIIIARRLQVFHPETAEPLLTELLALGEAGHPHHLERALNLPLHEDPDIWLRTLVDVRLSGAWDEAICAQLWLGTRLGLRQHPNLGRYLLASLLDNLAREGGHPDVEEAATAVLLLISMAHDWRTDLQRVELQVWGRKPVTSPMLAGVAELVAAMVSMQQDRMVTAHAHAVSALASFSVADTYGLQLFASALTAATASYVDSGMAAEAHHYHRARALPHAAPGLPWVRLLAQGFATIGSGPPTHEVAAQLTELAVQAREEGEWNQEQQLLLLAMLGGSEQAVTQALTAPWAHQPGRARLIHLLAENFVEHDDQTALQAAQLLITSGGRFFGLSIIAARWARRAQMARSVRVETVRTVLTLRQQAPEYSELLESFEGLELNARERLIVEGLLRGHSTSAIAKAISLSPRTVESAVSRLLTRFGCENRLELISLDLLPATP